MGRVHVVEQGECFASIAQRHGLAHWQTLLDMPENRDLVERRKNPHVLFAGDRVTLPDTLNPATQRSLSTGQRHRFVRKEMLVKLKLRIRDHNGVTLANRPCRLYLEGRADPIDTTLTGNAELEQQIPASVRRADLLVWHEDEGVHDDETLCLHFPLRIGHLDPIDTLSGAQSRLNNLGFRCPRTGELDAKTRNALRAFQHKHKLDETGELDDATRDKLVNAHEGT